MMWKLRFWFPLVKLRAKTKNRQISIGSLD
jgi:hypothetical protein